MFTQTEKEKINVFFNLALNRIKDKHIGCFKGHEKPVFLISDTYPGVWLEHAYDSVFFAKMYPEYKDIAKNTLNLFLDRQKENGQLPCFVIDKNKGKNWNEVGFSQTQECVSFAALCYEYFELAKDFNFLKKAYEACKRWKRWYDENRMPGNKGLVEMFCGHDTGHDNSGRMTGMTYKGRAKDDDAANYPEGDEVLPVIAPDINAVYYGTLMALSKMADVLEKPSEAKKWCLEADTVKKALLKMCFDEDDCFFYDVDKNGKMRKYLSISITNVLSEHVIDKELAEKIFRRHIKNPEEFYTDYPFPAMAKCDPSFSQNASGNSWGFYSQALTMLRCTRWMDFYGFDKDFDEVLEKWVRQWTFGNDIMFGQELNPITGKASDCSEWYSSCMLIYIYAVIRLNIKNI